MCTCIKIIVFVEGNRRAAPWCNGEPCPQSHAYSMSIHMRGMSIMRDRN